MVRERETRSGEIKGTGVPGPEREWNEPREKKRKKIFLIPGKSGKWENFNETEPNVAFNWQRSTAPNSNQLERSRNVFGFDFGIVRSERRPRFFFSHTRKSSLRLNLLMTDWIDNARTRHPFPCPGNYSQDYKYLRRITAAAEINCILPDFQGRTDRNCD